MIIKEVCFGIFRLATLQGNAIPRTQHFDNLKRYYL